MLFKDLRGRIKLGSHKNTLPFFIVTMVGSLLPFGIGFLFFVRPGHWEGWTIFYGKGEFYLYSAALLTSASYLFYTFKQKNYDIFSVLFFICCILVLIISVFYAFLLSDKTPPDHNFLRNSSAVFFVISVFIFYWANYMNYKYIDFLEGERKGIQAIMGQLP